MRARRQQRAGQRRGAAGLRVVECRRRGAGCARPWRGRAARACCIGQVVRQVGADDDQRLVAAPQALEHLRHLVGAGVADGQRHQREGGQRALQERQLHLERMLPRMGRGVDLHLAQPAQLRRRVRIELDAAERRVEGGGIAQGQAAHGDAMGGAEQHDAPDLAAPRRQQGIGLCRHRPRVHVAGVRHDEHLGRPRDFPPPLQRRADGRHRVPACAHRLHRTGPPLKRDVYHPT